MVADAVLAILLPCRFCHTRPDGGLRSAGSSDTRDTEPVCNARIVRFGRRMRRKDFA
jgi:hypothetical protein